MYTLTMTETYPAPLERLFRAWSSSEQLKRWFAPGDMHVPEASIDLRPGGRYRIVMQETDGQQHIVTGEYREIAQNERLAFTWQWEGSDAVTYVEVGFRALDAQRTEVSLKHTQFATEATRDSHGKGWGGCLANLGKVFQAGGQSK